MADNGHIYGFRPYKSRHGDALPSPIRCAIADNNAAEYHAGDPLKILSTGYYVLATAGDKVDAVVTRIGPYYNGTRFAMHTDYLPKNTVYGTNYERQSFLYAIPAQRTVFECDCDDNTTATTYATYLSYIGENVEMVLGDGTSGASDPKLDISTHATTNTLSWRIVGISEQMTFLDFSAQNVKLLVIPNLTAESPWTTTGT